MMNINHLIDNDMKTVKFFIPLLILLSGGGNILYGGVWSESIRSGYSGDSVGMAQSHFLHS